MTISDDARRPCPLFQEMTPFAGMLILAILLIVPSAKAASGQHAFRTISTTSPRAMAMGGAFISIRDSLAAPVWNPASLVLYNREVHHRLAVYFNPVISTALLQEHHRDVSDILAALATAVKAITYSHRWAEFGLLLWEQPLYDPLAPMDGKFFPGDRILDHHSHSLGMRIRLAPTVSLGSTGSLYKIQDEKGHSTMAGGINYGVLLRPAKSLEIGLAYFDFPSSVADLRQDLEGIRDESVNCGLSLHPDDRTILAIDLRDASGGETISWNRLRFGFERIFWQRLAVRLGYFQTGESRHDVYACGLGLIFSGGGNNDTFPPELGTFLAHYALLVEEGRDHQRYWHLLSVLFTI